MASYLIIPIGSKRHSSLKESRSRQPRQFRPDPVVPAWPGDIIGESSHARFDDALSSTQHLPAADLELLSESMIRASIGGIENDATAKHGSLRGLSATD